MSGGLERIGLIVVAVAICPAAFTVYMRWAYALRRRRRGGEGV
jgi:hypothetical protein